MVCCWKGMESLQCGSQNNHVCHIVIAVFRDICVFLAFKFSRKTSIKFHAYVSHCVKNSSLTIVWNNLGLSNYKHMKRKLGLKNKQKTCYNFKRNYVVPYSKENHLTLMHL